MLLFSPVCSKHCSRYTQTFHLDILESHGKVYIVKVISPWPVVTFNSFQNTYFEYTHHFIHWAHCGYILLNIQNIPSDLPTGYIGVTWLGTQQLSHLPPTSTEQGVLICFFWALAGLWAAMAIQPGNTGVPSGLYKPYNMCWGLAAV